MFNVSSDQSGKVLVAFLWIVGIILTVVVLAVLLTVTGSYKYPPSAVNYPVVGQFIARYGALRETIETTDNTGEQATTPPSENQVSEDQVAVLYRDNSLKAQQIEDLKGQLETKTDQISELEERMQVLQTQLDTYKQKNLKALTNVYDRMETRAATEILSQMTPERVAIILGSLKDKKAAEILASMDPQTALSITQIMGGFDHGTPPSPQQPPNPPSMFPQRKIQALPTPTTPQQPGSQIVGPPMNPSDSSQTVGPMPPAAENTDAKKEKEKADKEKAEKEKKEKEAKSKAEKASDKPTSNT